MLELIYVAAGLLGGFPAFLGALYALAWIAGCFEDLE